MNLERYSKPVFLLSWIANFALWLLVVFVLFKIVFASTQQPFGVVFSFGAFALLFILFSVSLAVYLKTKSYASLILTIIFMIGQAVCVIVTTVAIFSDERIQEKINFSNNPVAWITNHRWLPILFSIVFLPIFIIQTFFVNRHTQSHRSLETGNENEMHNTHRNTAHYYPQQKDYMPAGTRG